LSKPWTVNWVREMQNWCWTLGRRLCRNE
jgi:hypothetical protein